MIIPITRKKPWSENKYYSHYRWQIELKKSSIVIQRASLSREDNRWAPMDYYGVWLDFKSKNGYFTYHTIWYDGEHSAFWVGPVCIGWGD